MNPSLDLEIVRAAYEDDSTAASAEYGAQFRSDCERLFNLEMLDAVHRLRPAGYFAADFRGRSMRFFAFVDPSGGSNDSMTMAIARLDKVALLCGHWEKRPPFSPDAVVEEFASITIYKIDSVTGDRYGGEWPRERFRMHGIAYVPSEKSRSEIYLEFLALVNSRRVRMPNNRRIRQQLVTLERRVSRAGKDSVDHSPGAHDDLANAVAGALCLALAGGGGLFELFVRVFRPGDEEKYSDLGPERMWRRLN